MPSSLTPILSTTAAQTIASRGALSQGAPASPPPQTPGVVSQAVQTEAVRFSLSPDVIAGFKGRPVVEASTKKTPPAYNADKKPKDEAKGESSPKVSKKA